MATNAPTIPPAILARVAFHVAALHAWNAAILHARAMEAVAHQPGRYEWDLRYGFPGPTVRAPMRRALDQLALIEVEARTRDVTPAELYAGCGGKPALLEEGEHVLEWGHRP